MISYERFVQILVVFVLVLGFRLLDCYNDAYNKKKERDEKLFKQPPPQEEIVRFVSCSYHHFGRGMNINHVVGKSFVVGVFMQLEKQGQRKYQYVHFVELHFPLLKWRH